MSALCCPLATPTVLLGFLLPWRWVSLHGCSSKAQPLLLTLDVVASPDLERAVAPLGLPLPTQPPLLEHEGSSSRPLPRPQTWDSSSRCSCAVAAWRSRSPSQIYYLHLNFVAHWFITTGLSFPPAPGKDDFSFFSQIMECLQKPTLDSNFWF